MIMDGCDSVAVLLVRPVPSIGPASHRLGQDSHLCHDGTRCTRNTYMGRHHFSCTLLQKLTLYLLFVINASQLSRTP